MKLFIDTSNKKIVLALLSHTDQIVDFYIEDTNNDMVKNSISKLQNFLKNNKLVINDIHEFLLTTGPGSFTGVKVALNIVNSVALTKELNSFRVIDSFTLIENNDSIATAIPFGKSKYYLKMKRKKKIKVINQEEYDSLKNVNNGYDNLTKELLQEKINNNKFKIIDNLDKIKIKYLSAF